MDTQKTHFPLSLTFDDVLLLPNYVDFSRAEIDLSTNITKKIELKIPLVSSPMDTVTESKLAIELALNGGVGIIHRNLTIKDQSLEVKKVKTKKLLVGAAVGANSGVEDRIKALVKVGVDVIVVDSAHGYSKGVIETVRYIKKIYPKQQIIAGNISTYDGALALIKAGADGLRVGMGPGAICTTRIISGMGVPQVTAIFETVRAARKLGIPVVADGGIRYSGDITKALAAGASAVMMGSFFAAAKEAPGKIFKLKKHDVPDRFKSVFKNVNDVRLFKQFRGMGSIGAMEKGTKIKSEDEFHGKNYKDRILVAEGVEGLVPIKGTVKELVDQAIGGIKSGMYYVGTKSIKELRSKARFTQITQASLSESHPHSIVVTNPGENYS